MSIRSLPLVARRFSVALLVGVAVLALPPARAAQPDVGRNAVRAGVAGGTVRVTGAVVVGTVATPADLTVLMAPGRLDAVARARGPARVVRVQHMRQHELSIQLRLLERPGEQWRVHDEAVVTYE